MADRDILFRIGVGSHPETAKRLAELQAAIKQTMVQSEMAIGSVAAKARSAAAEIVAANATVGAGIGSGGGVGGTFPSGAGRTNGNRLPGSSTVSPSGAGRGVGGFSDPLGGLRDDAINGARQTGVEAAKQTRKSYTDTIARMGGLSEADIKTLLGADDADLLALAENQADKYASGVRAGLKSQLGGSGVDLGELFGAQGGAGLKQQQQEYADETARVTQELQGQLSTMEKLRGEGDQMGRALSSNFREVAQKGEEMASGLGQAASGVAYLFAGNEDAKKLIDTLLTIKGTSDIVLGGFKAFSGVTQFISVLGDRTKLLADKQKNQADQTRVGQQAIANYTKMLERQNIKLVDAVGGNERHAAALREVAAAANQAATAEGKLAATGGGGGVSGGGRTGGRGGRFGRLGRGLSGVAGSVASMGAYEAISSVTGGSGLLAGAGSIGVDAALSGGLGGIGGGGAAASVGALAAPVAAAAAALGSLALVGKELQEVFSGTATQAGSVTDTIASWEVRVADWVGDMTGVFDLVDSTGVEAGQKLQKKNQVKGIQDALTSELTQIDRTKQFKLDDNSTRATQQQRQLGVEGGRMTGVEAAQANLSDNAQGLAKELKIVADYQKGIVTDEQLYLSALERANSLTASRVDLEKAALAAVREEAAARKDLNSQSITAAEQRIGLIEKERGIFKTNEQRVEEAAIKFSRMSQGDQVGVIRAQEVAQSGGTLSRKQREQLDSLGLGAESNVVRKQDLADARQSGFFERFGAFENRQMQGSQSRLGGIMGLQQQAAGVDAAGLTKEQREQRLLALNQRQENIGRAQGIASGATAGGPSAGERQFDRGVQQVRVEIADRKNFSIQIEANEKAIAATIAQAVAKSEKGMAQRIQKYVDIEMRKAQTAAVATANQSMAQLKNSKPT